jgi:hypothetical protein
MSQSKGGSFQSHSPLRYGSPIGLYTERDPSIECKVKDRDSLRPRKHFEVFISARKKFFKIFFQKALPGSMGINPGSVKVNY